MIGNGTPADVTLRLSQVSRSFGEVQVFHNLDLEIARGEFLAVVGPSGCGKSTLLNLLSGFDEPTSGSITRQGKTRMVFQQDGLLPWLTAAGNIALGLRDIKNETERQAQIREMLSLIRLENFGDHYPHQLSGGMRQRVEIARALAWRNRHPALGRAVFGARLPHTPAPAP
jgi:ABC-type nitrate/sulfonate/bicarbonate transport system ATPase subunit